MHFCFKGNFAECFCLVLSPLKLTLLLDFHRDFIIRKYISKFCVFFSPARTRTSDVQMSLQLWQSEPIKPGAEAAINNSCFVQLFKIVLNSPRVESTWNFSSQLNPRCKMSKWQNSFWAGLERLTYHILYEAYIFYGTIIFQLKQLPFCHSPGGNKWNVVDGELSHSKWTDTFRRRV